jgi:hypothetical protein
MQRFPGTNFKPLIRCKGLLGPGVTFSGAATPLYEIHAVAGAARVSARIYCPTGGGNIALLFMGPDVDVDRVIANAPAYAAITTYVDQGFKGAGATASTIYATGNPTAVAVVAAVESQIISDCYGESFVIVQFTPNVGGSIGYSDVSRV